MLKFYEVDKDYIRYLKGYEGKIPNIAYDHHDKFICGILFTINGMNYYAPISSFTKRQRTNVLIKNGKGKVTSSIRLSFMFPVPPDKVAVKDFAKEAPAYRRLLMEEAKYCNRHMAEIIDKAQYIYEAVTEKHNQMMCENCCDFKTLEKAYAIFIRKEKEVQALRNGQYQQTPPRRSFHELVNEAGIEADQRNGEKTALVATHEKQER